MNHALERFVLAQNTGETWKHALAEVTAGRKTTHWMWFVFPVIAGIGSSAMARRYWLSGLSEAAAYLGHPILGPRLVRISNAAAAHTGLSANRIFGSTDAWKLHNCATLFRHVEGADPVFDALLRNFFDGKDARDTDRLLSGDV